MRFFGKESKSIFANWYMVCDQSGNINTYQIQRSEIFQPNTAFSISRLYRLVVIIV